jgi:hypothetical protein
MPEYALVNRDAVIFGGVLPDRPDGGKYFRSCTVPVMVEKFRGISVVRSVRLVTGLYEVGCLVAIRRPRRSVEDQSSRSVEISVVEIRDRDADSREDEEGYPCIDPHSVAREEWTMSVGVGRVSLTVYKYRCVVVAAIT